MTHFSKIIVCLTAAALAATANAAQLTFRDNVLGSNATIEYRGVGEGTFAGFIGVGLAGAPASYPTSFRSLCVDLDHRVSWGEQWDVNLVPLPDAGLNQSGRIAYLYNKYINSLTTNDDATGLQLAVWDLVVDGGNGLDTGNFRVRQASAHAVAAGNQFIAESADKSDTATWLVSARGTKQNLIGPGCPGNSVPEPGSLALLGTVILPLLGFWRRR